MGEPDIVERLRDQHRRWSGDYIVDGEAFGLAANEIERLKTAAAEFSRQMAQKICNYEDEIERLRAEVDLKGHRLDDALVELADVYDETERLGREIERLKGHIGIQYEWIEQIKAGR